MPIRKKDQSRNIRQLRKGVGVGNLRSNHLETELYQPCNNYLPFILTFMWSSVVLSSTTGRRVVLYLISILVLCTYSEATSKPPTTFRWIFYKTNIFSVVVLVVQVVAFACFSLKQLCKNYIHFTKPTPLLIFKIVTPVKPSQVSVVNNDVCKIF